MGLRGVIAFSVCVFLLACSDKSSEKSTTRVEKPQTILVSDVPEFNSDSAFRYIRQQVEFGPRVPNSDAHLKCGNFLHRELKRHGCQVYVQEFTAEAYDGTRLYLRNFIGAVNSEAKKRILIAAHWDTRHVADKDTERTDEPISGANDGASGVGVILELARILNGALPEEVGVDFILFDGEDYGVPVNYSGKNNDPDNGWCLGSRHWTENRIPENYGAFFGILLDMVGAENATFYQEKYSLGFARSIVRKIWNIAAMLGFEHTFIDRPGGFVIDDHYYVNKDAGIPMVNIIDYRPESFFFEHHHTHQDNLSQIDPQTLKIVGRTVVQTIFQEVVRKDQAVF
jgi:hypothetical protein